MSESSSNADELQVLAILNLTRMRAEGRTPAPIPVKQPPATPLTPRKAPESAPLASLHPPITPDDRARAAETLRETRLDILDYITENPKFLRPDGNLNQQWSWRVAAMDSDGNGFLLEEPGMRPRVNTEYNSIEWMQQDRETNKSPWGESSLRWQVRRSADPRAHAAAQQSRRVGGQYSKDLVGGDVEEADVMDAKDDVDAELEGML